MAMTITRLATAPVYAVLPAEDLDRARMFWKDTMGLEIEESDPDGFMVHAGSGTQFLVYHSELTHPCGYTAAVWDVADLRATMMDLIDHGVSFEEYDLEYVKTVDGIAEDKMGWAAWFKDSEGNIINLMQRK